MYQIHLLLQLLIRAAAQPDAADNHIQIDARFNFHLPDGISGCIGRGCIVEQECRRYMKYRNPDNNVCKRHLVLTGSSTAIFDNKAPRLDIISGSCLTAVLKHQKRPCSTAGQASNDDMSCQGNISRHGYYFFSTIAISSQSGNLGQSMQSFQILWGKSSLETTAKPNDSKNFGL